MLKIALTGGIGSGKSTAAKIFAELGIAVIDADKVVHELLQKKTAIYAQVVEHFGKKFLTPNQDIDRKSLREYIFSNPAERKWLENLLHPLVYQTILERISQQSIQTKSPYCILAIPLLFETIELAKQFKVFDRILTIESTVEKQIQRTMERDKISQEQAKKIIATQIDRDFRISHADDIIYNDGTIEELHKKIVALHEKYRALT